MNRTYFEYYVLSYFRKDQIRTTSQILHIFHGKRTPSMFYLTEINKKHHGFAQFKRISRTQLDELMKKLQSLKYIKPKEKGYVLTDEGAKACKEYFNTKYYPKLTKKFTYINVKSSFWERYQLFTQVFSEYSYKNAKYIPIIKHSAHQENVRQLFYSFKQDKDKVFSQWILENQLIFESLQEQTALTLTNLLTGHQLVGKTKEQVANYYQMANLEFHFYFLDCLEELVNVIVSLKDQTPLITNILKQVVEETFNGLSPSTHITFQLILKGYSLPQIAEQRRIKINTVKEHILEMVFVFDKNNYQDYVPEELYFKMNKLFDENKNLTYKEARQKIDNLEFMYFRIVELERLRM